MGLRGIIGYPASEKPEIKIYGGGSRMENVVFLDDIQFKADRTALMRMLHIQEGSEDSKRLEELIREAEDIARPKLLYKTAYIDEKGEDSVTIEGIRFTSRVLRVNLDQVYRVFPYVMTCGREVEDWANQLEDFLERYWADKIMEAALASATKAFDEHFKENYPVGQTASMNPGSLEDWPITEQKSLFALLGDAFQKTGVELTESFLMLPVKSVSGIRVPTQTNYENCQLCPRQNCPGRRSAYDETLFERKYKKK